MKNILGGFDQLRQCTFVQILLTLHPHYLVFVGSLEAMPAHSHSVWLVCIRDCACPLGGGGMPTTVSGIYMPKPPKFKAVPVDILR